MVCVAFLYPYSGVSETFVGNSINVNDQIAKFIERNAKEKVNVHVGKRRLFQQHLGNEKTSL